MKMRKLVAVLMAVMMLCCIIPFSAAADGTSATISFADLADRVSCDDNQQVWKQNGITVTNDKAASTSNVNGKYYNPVRFYKGSDVTVEYPGMTMIKFACNSASYADVLANSIDGAVVDGTVVSVALDSVNSFTVSLSVGQVRVDSITVYTGDVPATPDEPETPDEPVAPSEDPEADTTLSIADAIALGASKEHNTYTAGKYFVTGVITEVYNTQYGNMYITDDAGNTLLIYGTYSADGSARYDAMDVQPVAGDTVTIYGMIGQYNGNAQIKNGWIVEHTAAGETPDEPVIPDEPVAPSVGVVTNPVAGVAYKFALEQTQKGALYYFTGVMSGYYGATETDINLGVDMYVEIVDGGYKLYFNDANGAKQYIKLEQSGTHYNFTFGAEGSVFTLDAEKNAFCAPAGDQICYMGTYGSYVTVGCLTAEKISDTDYIARLYAVGGETPDEPVTPDEPETPDEPVAPSIGVVTNPVAGVAYKFALEQTQKGALYYFTGAMSGYYGATETDVNLGVDMYVEIVDGGYKLYFNDANGAKQYIKLEQSGTHYNFTFGAEGSVFTLDAEKNAFCAPAGDQICYMGTYGSYVTVGCLTSEKISDTDYIARLYAVSTNEPETPDEPGTDSPETGDNTTVYVTLAVILVALSGAALVVTKKRA